MLVLVAGDELLISDKLVRCIDAQFPGVSFRRVMCTRKVYGYIWKCAEEGVRFDYVFLETATGRLCRSRIIACVRETMTKTKLILYPSAPGWLSAEDDAGDGAVTAPVTEESVRKAMGLQPAGKQSGTEGFREIKVHTFGNFDVFVDGKPLVFERQKAKELFAYLIDRKGAGVTTAEIASVLWEDREYNKGIRSQTTRTVSVMRKALVRAGTGDILIKSWNSLALDPARVICDAYAYERREQWAMNLYHGEYMKNYSWAERTNGELQKIPGAD